MSFLTGKRAKSTQASESTSEAQNSSSNSSQSNSTSSSLTENTQLPFLQQMLGGSVGGVGGANSMIGSILGLPGSNPAMGDAGFNNYKRAGGFDFAMDRGIGGMVANRAAKGVLNSGGTQKGIAQFMAGLQDQYLNNYLSQLQGFGNQGLQAAQILQGAGVRSGSNSNATSSSVGESSGWSNSNSVSDGISSGGKPGLLGLGAAIAASDRRLKTNIVPIERDGNTGLMVYEFEYKKQPGVKHIGVMAQEVKEQMPEALGPETEDGYMTVNYAKVWGLD